MRATLWFLSLFSAAVAVALFAGNNRGSITIFWPPHAIDLSLNMVLLLLVGGFIFLYMAIRGFSGLVALPRRARQWRLQKKEREMHRALLEAMTHMLGGRFLRARKAALTALTEEKTFTAAKGSLPHGPQLRTLAHLVAAEGSHALQDTTARDAHLQQAFDDNPANGNAQQQELREGAQMRAARWAVDDREPDLALERLAALPQGASRRTLALRIKLKASRLGRQLNIALDTARLLAKHRAFSDAAAASIVRGLSIELVNGAHDTNQLRKVWSTFEATERTSPELAITAAQRLHALGGTSNEIREWLNPLWQRWIDTPESLTSSQTLQLTLALEGSFNAQEPDSDWLARMEAAYQANPRDARLQYLAGVACLHNQLWGKAQQMLSQATRQLQDPELKVRTWRHMAALAEQRGDTAEAMHAWKMAAQAR